jgi:CRISPR/Cas system-associated exonuclease Cas4 (RecB family)
MNPFQKFYTALFAILIIAFGYYFYTGSQLNNARVESRKYDRMLKDFNYQAEKIYQYKKTIEIKKNVLDERSKGDLEMPNVLRLARAHGIKPPRNSGDDIIDKFTHREKNVKVSLDNEKLKNVIKFLIEVEKLGDSNVRSISFSRTKKDKDLWDALISIVKIIPKETK